MKRKNKNSPKNKASYARRILTIGPSGSGIRLAGLLEVLPVSLPPISLEKQSRKRQDETGEKIRRVRFPRGELVHRTNLVWPFTKLVGRFTVSSGVATRRTVIFLTR